MLSASVSELAVAEGIMPLAVSGRADRLVADAEEEVAGLASAAAKELPKVEGEVPEGCVPTP